MWRRADPGVLGVLKTIMPRYYFNLGDFGPAIDDVGEEFPSTEAALVHAFHIAGELARNRPAQELKGVRLVILNEDSCAIDDVELCEATEVLA